jgi:hypothetical protein
MTERGDRGWDGPLLVNFGSGDGWAGMNEHATNNNPQILFLQILYHLLQSYYACFGVHLSMLGKDTCIIRIYVVPVTHSKHPPQP